MKLKVYRLREAAKIPHRSHETDAGLDIHYCPDNKKKLYAEDKEFYIPPHTSRVLPTGIKVEIPHGHMLEIKNKSSVALFGQLLVGAGVVDEGYDGEIYVNLHNVGPTTQVIQPGQKVAQVVMIPVVYCKVEEVQTDKLLNLNSSRGNRGFGSTGDM
tara:strand:+ start:626 stop:1096 length:471 start_codon:yes stop_codon:yes gene_type:complete